MIFVWAETWRMKKGQLGRGAESRWRYFIMVYITKSQRQKRAWCVWSIFRSKSWMCQHLQTRQKQKSQPSVWSVQQEEIRKTGECFKKWSAVLKAERLSSYSVALGKSLHLSKLNFLIRKMWTKIAPHSSVVGSIKKCVCNVLCV